MKYYKIGDRVEDNGNLYEVREGEAGCLGCSLLDPDGHECQDESRRFGHCSAMNRKDKEDVIFVQIGDGND